MPIEVFNPKQVLQAGVDTSRNANALMAPGRALEGLGQQGQQVSKALEHFSLKKQEAKNLADVTAAETAMETAFADFQRQAAEEGNEERWTALWNKTFSERMAAVGQNNSHAPVVKEYLNRKALEFKGKSDIQVANMVAKRSIQRSKAKIETSYEQALENGNLDQATMFIKRGEKGGLYSPEEAQAKISRAEARIDEYDVNRMIAEDPEGTYELLMDKTETGRWRNYKNLAPDTRNSLTARARREKGISQSEFYAELAFDTAKNGPRSIEDIRSMVDAGNLTKQQGAAYIREYHSPELHPLDPTVMASALRAVESYDPSQDPFYEQYAQLHSQIFTLPAKQSTELLARLKDKAKRGPGSGNTGDMVTRRLDRMFSANFFSGGIAPVGKDGVAKANIAYLEMVEAAQQIITDNPKMAASEVMEHLLQTPSASKAIAEQARQLNSSNAFRPNPLDPEKKSAFAQATFRSFQARYPNLRPDMTEKEMILEVINSTQDPKQAAKDQALVKKLYRSLNAQ